MEMQQSTVLGEFLLHKQWLIVPGHCQMGAPGLWQLEAKCLLQSVEHCLIDLHILRNEPGAWYCQNLWLSTVKATFAWRIVYFVDHEGSTRFCYMQWCSTEILDYFQLCGWASSPHAVLCQHFWCSVLESASYWMCCGGYQWIRWLSLLLSLPSDDEECARPPAPASHCPHFIMLWVFHCADVFKHLMINLMSVMPLICFGQVSLYTVWIICSVSADFLYRNIVKMSWQTQALQDYHICFCPGTFWSYNVNFSHLHRWLVDITQT